MGLVSINRASRATPPPARDPDAMVSQTSSEIPDGTYDTDGMEAKGRKAEQSEATRTALIAVARKLFAERGYEDTATEEVVKHAGVTRGALYHHFTDKKDLFRAVFEEMEQEGAQKIIEKISETPKAGPWEMLMTGCQAFLDSCLDPEFQQISLLDAPSVLGWEAWRKIDEKHSFGLMRKGIQAAMDAGAIEKQDLDFLSHMILGALSEAALMMVREQDPAQARIQAGESLTRLLKGLRSRK